MIFKHLEHWKYTIVRLFVWSHNTWRRANLSALIPSFFCEFVKYLSQELRIHLFVTVPTIQKLNHSIADLEKVQILNGRFSDPHRIKSGLFRFSVGKLNGLSI